MSINRVEKRHEFTRGAEVMRHEFGLYFSALFFSFMLAAIAAFGTSIFILNAALQGDEGEIFLARMAAEYNVQSGSPRDLVKMEFERGDRIKVFEVPADQLLISTSPEWKVIKMKMVYTGWFSVACGVALFFMTNWAWRQFGKKVGKDEIVRGTEFVDPNVMAARLKKEKRQSAVTLAGVPLEEGKEVLNIMVTGAVGTGKSVAIFEALECIRRSGRKVIIVDVTGECIERFYRDGQDVILNAFDTRMPGWSVWNEAKHSYDYANIAESFIPVQNRSEPFWEEGAQAVLEDIMARLAQKQQGTNRRLLEVINLLTLEEIQEILKSTPGAVFMDPNASKTAIGIRMNVVRAAKSMRYLADSSPEDQFSIRDWVTSEDQDSWLFLSTREDMLTTMRPLITAWLDIALRAVMTLKPDRQRLIWQVADELASLNKINSLEEVVTRGRKYGLASILGYQNISQLRSIYGDNPAQTISSMCQTILTLRVPDFTTAKYIAENLGEQEIYERDENISYGKDPTRDGVTISTRRDTVSLVMPSQIQGLPDLTGYMRLAGRNEVMKVSFRYKDYPQIAAGFIPKEVVTYALND